MVFQDQGEFTSCPCTALAGAFGGYGCLAFRIFFGDSIMQRRLRGVVPQMVLKGLALHNFMQVDML